MQIFYPKCLRIAARVRRALVGGCVAALILNVSSHAGSQANVSDYRAKVDGSAEAFAGDCPDFAPPGPLTCHEWDIFIFREADQSDGGGLPPPKTPWHLFLLRHTLMFPGGNTPPIETDAAFALVIVTDVTFDKEHLTSASVHAQNLTLSDGTIANVDASWTAKSDIRKYGNDSPLIDYEGFLQHYHQGCLTMNNLGEQKIVTADMSAVVNGVQYEYDGVNGQISTGNFRYIEIVPANCA